MSANRRKNTSLFPSQNTSALNSIFESHIRNLENIKSPQRKNLKEIPSLWMDRTKERKKLLREYKNPYYSSAREPQYSQAPRYTKNTPFVSDLKFIDIILRPGNCIFMPAHWFVSWTTNTTTKTPMVCTISYHTPISYMAFHTSHISYKEFK